MARVLVAIPVYDADIKPDTWASTANLDWGEHDLWYEPYKGHDCEKNRNRIVRQMLDRKFDYCLMVDNDTVVPVDALTNLMELDEPLAMGWCAMQGSFAPPHGDGFTCLRKMSDFNEKFTGEEMKALAASGDYKVPISRGGMACALIRRDAVEKTAYPWFKYVENADGSFLSEDYYFCKRLRDAGIQPYADARVECGHYFKHVEFL